MARMNKKKIGNHQIDSLHKIILLVYIEASYRNIAIAYCMQKGGRGSRKHVTLHT